LAAGAWDEALLADVDLSPALWPKVIASKAIVGGLLRGPAHALGVRPGTPVIAGAGDPGAASVRDGLEYSLSRRLALDVAAAKGASPGVAAMLAGEAPPATLSGPGLAARFIRPEGRAAEFDALVRQAQAADARARPRYEAAVLLAVALGATPTAGERAVIAGFVTPPGAAASGRLAALDLAADAGLKGETALMALAIVADAEGKPRPADYAPMVSALRRVGLPDAAVAFAGEAFAALQIE
jgi:hypothetical protein